jgi:hypothetical protein
MVGICGRSCLRLQRLTPDKVAQAFTLVELVVPDISRGTWRKFARGRISQASSLSGGILTVQDSQGIIVGLASYIIEKDVNVGQILRIDQLVSVAIIAQQRNLVMATLLDAMEDIATNHRCSAIRFRLGPFGPAIRDREAHRLLETFGFSHG